MLLQEGPRSLSVSSSSAAERLCLSFDHNLGAGIPQSPGQGHFPEYGCPRERSKQKRWRGNVGKDGVYGIANFLAISTLFSYKYNHSL